MPHDNDSNIEIEEVVDYLVREAMKLKKVCDVYGLGTISVTLEIAMAEARRLVSRESDSEATEQ